MRSLSRLTWIVLALLAALSVAGWGVIRHSVGNQDQAVLANNAGQINLLLETDLQNLRTELASVAFFTHASGNSHAVFSDQARPLLTSPAVSVALVDVSTPQPRVFIAAGRYLQAGQVLPAPLAQSVLNRGTQLTSGIFRSGGQTFLYLDVAPSTDPNVVGLQLTLLRPQQPVANSSGPYSRVYVDLYEGAVADPSHLILTSYGLGPLPGPTAKAVTKVGGVAWLVEVAAKSPPSGTYAAASPWIALGIGLAVAVAVAALVETLARRNRQTARLLEERTALYAEQRTVAETLQSALLPESLPQMARVEAAVRYQPGVEGIHVGGDWYDVLVIDDAHILAVVGDVSGRGLPAASVMASVRFTARAFASQGDAPDVILSKLSNCLSVERDGQFATVLLVLIDLDRRELTVANGGHLPPLLVHDSGAEYIDAELGVPIGVEPDTTYGSSTVPMPAQATLLGFTDGLVERRGENLDVGLERVRQAALATDGAPVQEVLSSLMEELVGPTAADDVVLLVLRWRT